MNSEQFVTLFNATYPHKKIGESYYAWRFAESNDQLFSDEDNQILKGCVGLQSVDVDGIRVGLIVDAMVGEFYRNGGRTFASLRTQMEKWAKANDLKALIMFPNRDGCKAWLGDKNWRVMGQVPTYTRSIEGRPRVASIFTARNVSPGDWSDAIADKFQVLYPDRVMAQRKQDYLRWRISKPMHNYTVLRVHKFGEHNPFGYLALKVFSDPKTGVVTGDIVDIAWAQHSIFTIEEMLRSALAYFSDMKVQEAKMWLWGSGALGIAARNIGFVQQGPSRSFLAKFLDPEYRWLTHPSRWYLTMLDSEMY